jgi:hypothetical protein
MTRATVSLTLGIVIRRWTAARKGAAQARLHLAHGPLQRIDLREVQLQHEPMVGGDGAVQRVDEGGAGGLETPPREVGQALGVLFTGDQRLQDRAATDA